MQFWLLKKGKVHFWLLKKSRAHFWLLKKGQGTAPSEIRKTWTLYITHSCLIFLNNSLNFKCLFMNLKIISFQNDIPYSPDHSKYKFKPFAPQTCNIATRKSNWARNNFQSLYLSWWLTFDSVHFFVCNKIPSSMKSWKALHATSNLSQT